MIEFLHTDPGQLVGALIAIVMCSAYAYLRGYSDGKNKRR